MKINRKLLFAITFSLLMLTAAFTAVAIDYEETADTVLDSDQVISGRMDEFSKRMIIIDGTRHSLCKNVMVYNNAGILIHIKDIEAAVNVKLYRNKGCVRKINVLSFAH